MRTIAKGFIRGFDPNSVKYLPSGLPILEMEFWQEPPNDPSIWRMMASGELAEEMRHLPEHTRVEVDCNVNQRKFVNAAGIPQNHVELWVIKILSTAVPKGNA